MSSDDDDTAFAAFLQRAQARQPRPEPQPEQEPQPQPEPEQEPEPEPVLALDPETETEIEQVLGTWAGSGPEPESGLPTRIPATIVEGSRDEAVCRSLPPPTISNLINEAHVSPLTHRRNTSPQPLRTSSPPPPPAQPEEEAAAGRAIIETTPITNSACDEAHAPPLILVESDEQAENLLFTPDAGAVVVDFGASWCGPCKAIAPAFDSLASGPAAAGRGLCFAKVDVDVCEDTAEDCDVESLPTFQFWHNGAKQSELVGADEQKLAAFVDAAVATLPPPPAPAVAAAAAAAAYYPAPALPNLTTSNPSASSMSTTGERETALLPSHAELEQRLQQRLATPTAPNGVPLVRGNSDKMQVTPTVQALLAEGDVPHALQQASPSRQGSTPSTPRGQQQQYQPAIATATNEIKGGVGIMMTPMRFSPQAAPPPTPSFTPIVAADGGGTAAAEPSAGDDERSEEEEEEQEGHGTLDLLPSLTTRLTSEWTSRATVGY